MARYISMTKSISDTIRNDKLIAVIPGVVGLSCLILLLFRLNLVLIVLSIVFSGLTFTVYFLSKRKWIIQYNQEKDLIIIRGKNVCYTTKLTNVFNIVEYSHFVPSYNRDSYTNYCLYLIEPIAIGNEIPFTIYDGENELKNNYYFLRRKIVQMRSQKAKSAVKNTGDTNK